MGIDEKIFGWLYRAVARRVGRDAPEAARRAVITEPFLPRLRVLAGAGAGRMVDVRLTDGEGAVAGGTVWLPRRVSELPSYDDNRRLLFVSATLAGALLRQAGAASRRSPEQWTDEEADHAIQTLAEELPGWAAERDVLPPCSSPSLLIRGRYGEEAGAGASARASADLPSFPQRVTTERTAKRASPRPKRRRLLEEDRPENPLTHSFEKVHTVEEHRGGSKRADGSDELEDHSAALDEIAPEEVVLSNETVNSVYRGDAWLDSDEGGGEAVRACWSYDEWEDKRRRYLPRHCALDVERPEVDGGAAEALRARIESDQRRAIRAVKRELARIETAMRWHTRQPDGPDIDIDAMVDRASALRAGESGPTRLHVCRRRRGPSVSVMILLDASLSTDAWVENRRVLDVERDAAAAVGLALEESQLRFGLGAFCSFSRLDCRFVVLKTFTEPLRVGLGRLGPLAPRGYTRIGPALRHASALLEEEGTERRGILLLSDGKPTDADRYEGRHGMADVRQAVREARRRRIDVFAIAVDPRARATLPEMFGPRGFAALEAPGEIAHAAGDWVTHLIRP